MLGLIMAVLWLAIFAGLSVKWESTGQQAIRKGAGGHMEVDIPARPRLRSLGLLLAGIGLAPFWFVFGNHCTLTVPPAHVAAVYDPLRGGIQNVALMEGFHVAMPWWETQTFSQQTQEYTMSGSRQGVPEAAVTEDTAKHIAGDDAIRCQTNEGMNVAIDCTILFHVDPKDAQDVWRKLGDDVLRLIVRPYTQNVMRMVVARYSTEDVCSTKRKEIEQQIIDGMKPLFAEKGLVLEQILIRNVVYGNPAFADAINAKQVAQQQVQTEYQKLNRARIEKQTIIAEAQGEATAIAKRGATLRQNPEVVQYEFVQKVAPGLKSMYLPASSLPAMGGGK